MANWTIDRTINLDEKRTRRVLSLLLENPRKDESTMEATLISEGILKTGTEGALRRRWFTYLRNYGLMLGDDTTEMGELYATCKLSISDLALLQLVKRTLSFPNGQVVYPLRVFVLTVKKIIESFGIDEAYITKAEFSHYFVNLSSSEDANIDYLANQIIDERTQSQELEEINGEHTDIWFNNLKETGLFDIEGKSLFLKLDCIDLFNLLCSFYSADYKQKNAITLFDDKFVQKIPFPNVNAVSNGVVNSVNGAILYDLLFNGYSTKRISEKNYRRDGVAGVERQLRSFGVDLASADNRGLYKAFRDHVLIIINKLTSSDNEASRNIGKMLYSYQKSRFSSEAETSVDVAVTDDGENFLPYDKTRFLEDVFMTDDEYETLRQLLFYKKNVIIQGSPGVGKTFLARKLAYSIMGEEDSSRVEFVQFHQNYSYEDFIMGYKPNGNGFEIREGVFYDFCDKAKKDSTRDYFFIIDEINRGNVSKIFGELLMLIETDKRTDVIKLAYRDEEFCVPSNLYIIGMMNTADRSLAIMDYALRRRFSFFELEPAFEKDGFKKLLIANGVTETLIDSIISKFKALNAYIANEKESGLGNGFQIGHSYFCGKPNCSEDKWYSNIVRYEISPMLKEYWFDELDKANEWIGKIK